MSKNYENKIVKSLNPKLTLLVLFVILFSAYLKVFAIGSPYNPGDTLDPACAPGEANCIVSISSSPWTLNGSDVYYNGGNVGIGTNSPGASYKLEVLGNVKADNLYFPNFASGATPTTNGILYYGTTPIFVARDDTTYGATNSNYFIGRNAGNLTTNGGGANVALGENSSHSLTSGFGNIAVGGNSLNLNTTANYNTAVGYYSLSKTVGTANTGLGYYALQDNTSGTFNLALGGDALQKNITSSSNTAVGDSALRYNTAGSNNTAVGRKALTLVTGNNNIGLGYQAGDAITSGSNNIMIGYDIDAQSATGSNQLSIGNLIFGTGINGTGTSLSSGNIGIGVAIPGAKLDVAGSFKLVDGTQGASKVLTSDANGLASWQANSNWSLSGNSGTNSFTNFIGTTDAQDFVIKTNGNQVARFKGDGTNGVQMGFGTTTSGSNSSAFGFQTSAGGYASTALGYQTTATGDYSTAIGGNSTAFGALSTAIGFHSLSKSYSATTVGSYNDSTVGTNLTGFDPLNRAFEIGIGQSEGTRANAMTVLFNGNVGIGTITPSYNLQVGNSSISGIVARFEDSFGTCDVNPAVAAVVCSSDMNLKNNITDLSGNAFSIRSNLGDEINNSTLDKILSLTPVTYNWNKEEAGAPKHVGFIAQEVEQVFPDIVFTDSRTGLKSLAYTSLIPYTIASIKDMNIKLLDINDLTKPNSWRDSLVAWFGNVGNGIKDFVSDRIKARQEICINNTCINEAQLQQILQNQNTNNNSGSGSSTPPPADPVDLCPNIDGNQATIPDGMHLDTDNNCVADEVTPPADEEVTPDPEVNPEPEPVVEPTPEVVPPIEAETPTVPEPIPNP